MRGGGAKAVWNFSKNSSDFVAGPFPYRKYLLQKSVAELLIIRIEMFSSNSPKMIITSNQQLPANSSIPSITLTPLVSFLLLSLTASSIVLDQ